MDFDVFSVSGKALAAGVLLLFQEQLPVASVIPLTKDRRRNNCRLPDVKHVFNVLGTMESCPTYFCLGTESMFREFPQQRKPRRPVAEQLAKPPGAVRFASCTSQVMSGKKGNEARPFPPDDHGFLRMDPGIDLRGEKRPFVVLPMV